MRPQQVLPVEVKVDLGAIAVKEYSTLPKASGWLRVIYRTLIRCGGYLSASMLLVFSTAPANWALLEKTDLTV